MNKKELENSIKRFFAEWVEKKNNEKIKKIRYAGPKLGVDEYDAMLDAIFSDWWSAGKYTIKAEELLSELSDRNKSLLFNSGSSANLILMAGAKELYFNDGDKILTLSCNFCSNQCLEVSTQSCKVSSVRLQLFLNNGFS